MKRHFLLGVPALLAGLLLAAGVQAQGTALKNSEVTEDALIDALAIPVPESAASDGARLRGFRPAPRKAEAPRPAGPGKANLLITFRTNSAELTDESMRALGVVARALQSDTLAGFTFLVEGHADARGDADMNLILSKQRAESVAAYLVSQHGILAERLAAVGRGSSEPMNKTRVDAPENRRVTIVTNRD